jgi:hypothetical protein
MKIKLIVNIPGGVHCVRNRKECDYLSLCINGDDFCDLFGAKLTRGSHNDQPIKCRPCLKAEVMR